MSGLLCLLSTEACASFQLNSLYLGCLFLFSLKEKHLAQNGKNIFKKMVQFPENGSIYGCYGWGGMGSGVCVCVFNLGSRVCVFPCKGICVLATDSTVIWKWNENMSTWYEHDRAVIVLNLNSRMVFGFCPLNSCKAQSFFFLQQCPENTHSHTHTHHTPTHTYTHA